MAKINKSLWAFTDKYAFFTRVLPTSLVFLPLWGIIYLLLSRWLNQFHIYMKVIIEIFGGIPLCISAVWFLGISWVRDCAVSYEEKLFCNGEHFPTTEILLWSNKALSYQYKKKVHKKISADFSLKLSSEISEQKNPDEARRLIRDAINLIRKRMGDGRVILQYNIHYGFWRNLCAGAWHGLICSIILCIIGAFSEGNYLPLLSGIFFVIGYIILLLLRDRLMRKHGIRYAKVLISEYYGENKNGM